MMERPERYVLTGGPCSGKTTGKNYIFEKLSDFGVDPVFVPEVATMLINSGLDPRKMNKNQMRDFQGLIFRTQMSFEDSVFRDALAIKNGKRKVMICDRGCMDGAAYASQEDFEAMLVSNRLTRVDTRDERYDAVFHLVTAAVGAEKFYNLDNQARLETPAQARQVDQRTQEAWLGHEHLVIIDNSTDFEGKMKRLLNAIRKALGIPAALEIERKFVVGTNGIPPIPAGVASQDIEIKQVYLKSHGKETLRLRRRSQAGSSPIYYFTRKLPTESPMTRVETEKQIRAEEYCQMMKDADPELDPISKIRRCFIWNNQYFQLDVILAPQRLRYTVLLEIELTEENDKVEIPPWLGNVREVTDDPTYSNYALSRRA